MKFTAQKRENDFRVRVSKKVKFFRVLFLRFRVSKNAKRETRKLPSRYRYKRYQALQNVTERHIFYLTKNFKWTVLKLIYCLSIKFLFANMFINFFI